MSTLHPLNIFDSYGLPSKDLSEAEIAKLNPEQTAILFPLLDTFAASQAADLAYDKAESDRRKAITARDRAEKALEAATPQWTAHDEWLATVKRMPLPEPDPLVVKKKASATKAHDGAQQYLDACVAGIFPAKKLRDEKRAEFADWLRKWAAVSGTPRSVGDLVKERVRVETEIKLQNLANGLPADYVEQSASTVGPSHLDRSKAGGGAGHRGNINVGHNRNALRGAQLPKVPSAG
jgi:hypothetical protein